jgi:hypothetical protein
LQDLVAELDRQVKTVSNGEIVHALSNGSDDQQASGCDGQTPDERGIKEVVILEKKLEDLKSKNEVSTSVCMS